MNCYLNENIEYISAYRKCTKIRYAKFRESVEREANLMSRQPFYRSVRPGHVAVVFESQYFIARPMLYRAIMSLPCWQFTMSYPRCQSHGAILTSVHCCSSNVSPILHRRIQEFLRGLNLK